MIFLLISVRFGYAASTAEYAFQSISNYKIIYSKRHLHEINVLTHFKKVYNINYV